VGIRYVTPLYSQKLALTSRDSDHEVCFVCLTACRILRELCAVSISEFPFNNLGMWSLRSPELGRLHTYEKPFRIHSYVTSQYMWEHVYPALVTHIQYLCTKEFT
jgi:hypothetical protein